MTLDELKEVNKYAESTKSLTYLPQVHERQTERMKTRSQWFLAPSVDCCSCGGSVDMLLEDIDVKTLTSALMRRSSSGTIGENFKYFSLIQQYQNNGQNVVICKYQIISHLALHTSLLQVSRRDLGQKSSLWKNYELVF